MLGVIIGELGVVIDNAGDYYMASVRIIKGNVRGYVTCRGYNYR